MTLEQGTLLVVAGWIGASIFWAARQSGRIDTLEKMHVNDLDSLRDSQRMQTARLDQRIEACELQGRDQATAIRSIDDRTRVMDLKLSRIMGRLGVPHRAEDLDVEAT